MIETPPWFASWSWRSWTFGVVFGPEVWEIHLGPLGFGFDPEAWKQTRAIRITDE